MYTKLLYVFNLCIKSLLVTLSHHIEPLLLVIRHRLPPISTLSGKLCEDDLKGNTIWDNSEVRVLLKFGTSGSDFIIPVPQGASSYAPPYKFVQRMHRLSFSPWA